jgi:hypothetical protein
MTTIQNDKNDCTEEQKKTELPPPLKPSDAASDMVRIKELEDKAKRIEESIREKVTTSRANGVKRDEKRIDERLEGCTDCCGECCNGCDCVIS